jgi:hypothetical protein
MTRILEATSGNFRVARHPSTTATWQNRISGRRSGTNFRMILFQPLHQVQLVQHLARIVGVGFGVRGHDNSERRIHACPIRRRDFANEFAFSGLVVQAHQLRRKLAGVVEEQRFSARRPTVEPIIGGYAPDLPRLAPFEG